MYKVSSGFDEFGPDDPPYSFWPGLICVPLPECSTISLGPVDRSRLDKLQEQGFDQAPVKVPGEGVGWRLVATDKLRGLSEEGCELTRDAANFLPDDVFKIDVPLELTNVLNGLSHRSAALLVYEDASRTSAQDCEPWGLEGGTPAVVSDDNGAPREEHGIIFGLVTIADLNGQVVRKAGYEVILDIEIGLAKLLKLAFPEPWDWVRTLNEDGQVKVLGYWEVMRRRGLDSNPVGAATLTQLAQAVAKSKELLDLLGYKSKSQFDDTTGGLIVLRNQVMHPVRPLVLEQNDVAKIHEVVVSAMAMVPRVWAAVREYSGGSAA